jgi:hypothetical protein
MTTAEQAEALAIAMEENENVCSHCGDPLPCPRALILRRRKSLPQRERMFNRKQETWEE